MNDISRYTISIRLFCEGKCFGPGIWELLRRVHEQHSLRAAAAGMGMAYSKAWRIIRQSEAELGIQLLSTRAGGTGGGGAELTPEAQAVLGRYDAFLSDVAAAADNAFARHFLLAPHGEGAGTAKP